MSTLPEAPGGKRCLYEILGVGRDASADEIRSAYRRLALQLHPDKAKASSSASPAAATAAFQELVNAYEVLSDPRERSYYDSHRSQILFSSSSSSSSSSPVDLFSFFSSSVYYGFSDNGRGFYKVYADVFDSVHRQETRFQSHMGLPPESVPPAPLIGNLDSPYAQVTAFYSYWTGFRTILDFAWADIYDAAAGENRRSRRAMEEENRKVRSKARKEYNESVRALAEFVKKRDRRVVEMAVKRKEEEERKKEETRARKKEEERRRKEAAASYREPEWTIVEEEVEMDLFGEHGRKGEEDGASELLYCIACGKKFKTEKQWKNHEQSKKHKERVTELREAMLGEEEDGVSADGDGTDENGEDVEENGVEEDRDLMRNVNVDINVDEEEEVVVEGTTARVSDDDSGDGKMDKLCSELHARLRVEKEGDDSVASGISDQHEEEDSILEAMISGRKSRKGGSVHHHLDDSAAQKVEYGRDDSEDDGSMVYDNRKKGRRARVKRKGGKGNGDEVTSLKRDTGESTKDGNEVECEESGAKDTTSSPYPVGVKGRSGLGDRASGKNQKMKKQQPDERVTTKGRKNKGASKSSNLCETCGETFDSRNKLFMHLGDTGHAMLKSR